MSGRYVALGSSMAAGPGIRPRAPGAPCGSGRSARNYAHLVAEQLNLDLIDVTFSGATTAHVLAERQRGARPQIEALDGSEELVTITVGGNDVGCVPRARASPSGVHRLPDPAATGSDTGTAGVDGGRPTWSSCRRPAGRSHRGSRSGDWLRARACWASQSRPSRVVSGAVGAGCGLAAAMATGAVSPQRRGHARGGRFDRRADRKRLVFARLGRTRSAP